MAPYQRCTRFQTVIRRSEGVLVAVDDLFLYKFFGPFVEEPVFIVHYVEEG